MILFRYKSSTKYNERTVKIKCQTIKMETFKSPWEREKLNKEHTVHYFFICNLKVFLFQ